MKKTLFKSANELISEIQKNGFARKRLVKNQPIQDLINEINIYRLILTVKWFNNSATVPTENNLLQDRLIKAAKDLSKLTPDIEDYDFIERDVQHFMDSQGRKYTLSVVIRIYDSRGSEL